MLKFENVHELKDFIKNNGIKQIDVKFTNLFGGLHHITVPVARADSIFEFGIGIDGSSIPGFASTEKSDMVVMPDLCAGFIDPFFEVKTISFIGSIYDSVERTPSLFDPREIARKTESLLSKKSYADKSFWGPEYEFYVFDRVHFKNTEYTACYEVGSSEVLLSETGEMCTEDGYRIKRGRGYHAAPPRDRLFNFRSHVTNMLEDVGIEVKYHHHENGGAGQVEIEVELESLLRSADNGQIVKYFCKMVAFQQGLTATFMPKPLHNEAGSGMHFHQLLLKGAKPVFFKEESQDFEFTSTGLSYIAGLLVHAPSLVALTNPSTNSYRRLSSGFEAPSRSFFSISNRKASIRIPAYVKNPLQKRIEFRTPDATGNIYLSMSAILLAGIDGIEKGLDPFAEKLDNEESGPVLPSSLEKALLNLMSDKAYLTKDGIFTEELISSWIHSRAKELQEVESRPHPYEFEIYYDC